MIRKTISMPDSLGKYIDERVQSGGFGNDSEFVRDLLRRDKERSEAIRAVQAAIDEGMVGKASRKTVREIYETARKRHERDQKAKRK